MVVACRKLCSAAAGYRRRQPCSGARDLPVLRSPFGAACRLGLHRVGQGAADLQASAACRSDPMSASVNSSVPSAAPPALGRRSGPARSCKSGLVAPSQHWGVLLFRDGTRHWVSPLNRRYYDPIAGASMTISSRAARFWACCDSNSVEQSLNLFWDNASLRAKIQQVASPHSLQLVWGSSL